MLKLQKCHFYLVHTTFCEGYNTNKQYVYTILSQLYETKTFNTWGAFAISLSLTLTTRKQEKYINTHNNVEKFLFMCIS